MLKKKFKKFKKMWGNKNVATRTVVILGFIAFFHTVVELLENVVNPSESDVALRSIMLSIFGYILGSKVVTKYNKSDSFYIVIASIISILCISIIIISDFFNIDQTSQDAVAIRSLLASAIGFLISKSSLDHDK